MVGSVKDSSDSQIHLLRKLKGLSQRDSLILELLSRTGITVSELTQIKVSHISISKQELLIPKKNTKSKIARKIPLSKELLDRIRQLAKTEYLFSTRQSSNLTPRRVEQIVNLASRKAGLKITAREIRSNYLENIRKQGFSKEKLRRELGLKSIRPKTLVPAEQVERFKETIADDRTSIIFSIIEETAASLAEVCNLKAKDIGERKITFSGTKLARRRVAVSTSLYHRLRAITQQIDEDSSIFTTRQSKTITPRRVEQLFSQYSKASGLTFNLTPQILRSFATEQILADRPDATRILGVKTKHEEKQE